MDTIPSPASAIEAIDMVCAGLEYIADNAFTMTIEELAKCMEVLDQTHPETISPRAWILRALILRAWILRTCIAAPEIA